MGCVYLIGADSDVYEKSELEDLIAIKRHRGHNLATRTVADFWVRVWRRIICWKPKVQEFQTWVYIDAASINVEQGTEFRFVCEHNSLF